MADPRRLNLADQVLVNALAAICLPVIRDAGREKMLIAILREILPGTTDDNPQMAPLIAAARGFLDGPALDLPREAGAKLRAADPLTRFFEGRAAAALEAFRGARQEVANG